LYRDRHVYGVTMTDLAFYGGVGEIGGNKILLRDGATRVLLDFGQSFTMGEDYFYRWLSPRSLYGLRDYFEFDLLPRIRGLYDPRHLAHTDLPPADPAIDAVILSHAHFDHVAHLRFVDARIPVHCGACTRLFMASQEESSPTNLGEHDYRTFRTGDRIELGSLTVEPIHVDHSIAGAYGVILHTSQGAVVYTGDLRAHGPKPAMTEEFIARAAACDPVALVTEGTRMVDVERRANHTEAEVKAQSHAIVSNTQKVVFVTHYGRDMDRFRTMYEVATANDRRIVIPPKTAYLLAKLVADERLDLPDPLRDDAILVYYKRKRSGTYDPKDYYRWVDIQPERGCPFIHSMSEPFSEEDIEDAVLHAWLDHFGIRFHQLHASGHLNRQELTTMIERIRPKHVFPVHTEHPALFTQRFDTAVRVELERVYTL
jgi:ribonuclease J